jgi:hypothetical protein
LAVKGPRCCCCDPDVDRAFCLDVTFTKCDWWLCDRLSNE